MLNGLDLFSGIGGISLALGEWVRTIAYCERDRYAQAVLLSRMGTGQLHRAPIWDDVQTLDFTMLPPIDIISGGFPCQDISCAGTGVGLAGKRSGLFFEIMRLAEEIKPSFIFLENVPAIRTRGLHLVGRELAARGYDCRWCALSAQEVGANHKRNRWFLLAANTCDSRFRQFLQQKQKCGSKEQADPWGDGEAQSVAHATRDGLQKPYGGEPPALADATMSDWWSTEPDVGRVVNGLPHRVDRIKCLGNAVVPLQAREAFKRLTGIL